MRECLDMRDIVQESKKIRTNDLKVNFCVYKLSTDTTVLSRRGLL